MKIFKVTKDLNLVKNPVEELIKATAWFFVSREGYNDTHYTETRWKFMMEKIREAKPDYAFAFKKPDEILKEFDRVTSDTKLAKSETPF